MLLARRAMMGKKGLPSAYQQVEWINANGTYSWVDTGYYANKNTDVEIDFKMNNYSSVAGQGRLFGSRLLNQSKVENYAFVFGSNGAPTNGQFYFAEGGGDTHSHARYDYVNLTRKTHKWGKSGLYVNGTLFATYSFAGQQVTHWPCYLMCFNESGSVVNGKTCIANIYNCKIWESDVLVRDFIPCYRKSDNEIGMYDLCGSICPLTGTPFYINSGTGTFTKGPNV